VTTPAVERYPKRDLLSSAPKAAVQAIVRGIASEEGRYGVRANCVAVGLLEGEGMWDMLIERGDYTEEALAIAKRNIPLRRPGSLPNRPGRTTARPSSVRSATDSVTCYRTVL
jgi:3-oxoacyl-[acyl-carrier protein] reductase